MIKKSNGWNFSATKNGPNFYQEDVCLLNLATLGESVTQHRLIPESLRRIDKEICAEPPMSRDFGSRINTWYGMGRLGSCKL